MSNYLDIAQNEILSPAGMGIEDLRKYLHRAATRDTDLADLYFETSRAETWALEDGIVKEGSWSIDQGVGVRAVCGEKTGFAYSDEILPGALLQAAETARAITRGGDSGRIMAWRKEPATSLYTAADPIPTLSTAQKVSLLQRVDTLARQRDHRVKQVIASLGGQQTTILVASLDGAISADIRPLVRFNINVIVEENGRRERGNAGGGGRFGYDAFLTETAIQEFVNEAVDQALTNLAAEEAPAGAMTVVLGPGWPGILIHEAIGHGLEGDFNRKGTSAFSNRIGQKVAASEVTIVDDGTLLNRRGSVTIDDEGTPGQRTTLIENGVLVNYLQDKLNATLMGMQPTGNGRRESYAHLPLPRMTNTYMLNGGRDPGEIIESVTRGIYASQFGGGQVDITNGKFVFSASEAWLIENGKLTRPIRGATLIGNGPDVLTRVSMVGNDMRLDPGAGTCGKEGQSVPVGVGQPTIRIDELTVGGTSQSA